MNTYPEPGRRFVSGQGAWLTDDTGKRYLDMLSGLAVTSLGHSHQAVSAAISEQASKLLHVSNLFENEHTEALAEQIDQLIGNGQPVGGKVFFANSGAEANECAIKLARKFHGRQKHRVLSAYGSFHGRTLATLHATGQPSKHEAFEPLPEGFAHFSFNDFGDLARMADPTSVAGILLEPVQGEGGVVSLDPGFLKKVRELCDERQILLIVDEVQTGFARTGRWFGFQHHDVLPDIVTMAKALGNGVPIGACWARPEVADAFVPGDHATTYGGGALVAAASRAVLAEMLRIGAPALALRVGERIAEKFGQIDAVAWIRGVGALVALELRELSAPLVVQAALDHGVILNAVTNTALRLAPPLIISDTEIADAAARLGEAIDSLRSS